MRGSVTLRKFPGLSARAADRQINRILGQSRQARMRRPNDGEEGQFEKANDDRRPLHAPSAALFHRHFGARLASMRWSVRRCILSWRAVSETFRSQDS